MGVPDPDPLEEAVEVGGVRRQLGDRLLGEEAFESGLGCRAKDGTNTVVGHQLPDRRQAGLEIPERQHLCFVEDDHALGDVVNLAAARGLMRIERLEELHIGGDHDRNIPILRGQLQFDRHVIGHVTGRVTLSVPELLPVEVSMVLEHILLAEDILENRGVLLDDAGVGDDVNDAMESMSDGVVKREGLRDSVLAPPVGTVNVKNPCSYPALDKAAPQDLGTLRVDLRRGVIETVEHLVQNTAKGGNVEITTARSFAPVHEGLGLQEVGIDHTECRSFVSEMRKSRVRTRAEGESQRRLGMVICTRSISLLKAL